MFRGRNPTGLAVVDGRNRILTRAGASSDSVTPVGTTIEPGNPYRRFISTPDGLEIATYDFGGSGPDLLLVHATGFCSGVLAPLARHLTRHFHCWGLDLRAHGHSEGPKDGNFAWAGFATDVLSAVDVLGLEHPLGFGHSCGGASLMLAEQRHSGTFRALYCFEPVVFRSPSEAPTINDLSVGALRRRESFPSTTDAFLNFSSKPPFADLDPDALQAYVSDGFETVPPDEGGDGAMIRLRCRREDESQIYTHGASHDAFSHLGSIDCHVWLCCGALTDAFGVSFLRQDAEQLQASTIEVMPGVGHFGPLQRPDLVAGSIIGAFDLVDETPSS